MTTLRIRPLALAMLPTLAATAALAQTAPPAPLASQTPGFTNTPILAAPISGVEGKELVLIAVTMAPGASSPPHIHPGDCYGSVMEGAIELRVVGQPARRIAAGEAYANNAPGVPHQFVNVGGTPVRMVNTLVVEKGKPRTVVVPDAVR